MKKLVVAASMLAASFGAFAQDYKPVAGNVTAELGLVGAIGNTSLTLPNSGFAGTPNLRFRYFLQDKMAVRLGFNYSKFTETNKFYGASSSDEGTQKINSSVFGLNLGIEKHLAGTNRLSTYAGADLLLRFAGASEKWEKYDGTGFNNDYERTLKGANSNGDNGSFGFGLRAVAGAEYYFVEKVYLGGEFGWGFTAIKNGKTSDEVTTAGTTTTTETESNGGTFNLNPALSAGIRLGFRF
ncbi:MAG: hypothetical protein MUE33_04890 [Cytophagaceae bacterium]|jgi:hypothetical protein|nr:hypothetical protein [Cytophagaceae bacterium]